MKTIPKRLGRFGREKLHMRIRTSGLRALGVCTAVAMFVGCSGGGASQSSAPGYTGVNEAQPGAHLLGQRPIPFMGMRTGISHPDHHKSWLSPELKRLHNPVLFVSDFTAEDVYIFKLPSLTLLGTLTGFNGPQGECSDKLGHVWVTNTYSYQILEFAHDGSLVNTLTDPSGLPVSCAWDKKTGNLAVTNIYDFGGSQPPGEVLVYPGASGTPTAYTDADMYYYYSDGYDSHGNLFIDGTGGYPNYSFIFAELPSGNGSAHTIPISGGSIYFPGGVQWYGEGHYINVGDQDCSGNPSIPTGCVDWVSVSGSAGTITGTTHLLNPLGGPSCAVVQAVQQGTKLFASDIVFPSVCSGTTATRSWPYSAGGNPTRSSTAVEQEPDGTAISSFGE
jgi:hypothetical protein